MGAPKGNRYAAKSAHERADALLYVRLRVADRRRMEQAARAADLTLAAWARGVLLAAVVR